MTVTVYERRKVASSSPFNQSNLSASFYNGLKDSSKGGSKTGSLSASGNKDWSVPEPDWSHEAWSVRHRVQAVRPR